jgi:hypothetical protein
VRKNASSYWTWMLVAASSLLAAPASAGQDPRVEACQKGDGASCLRLGLDQLSLLNDDAATRWYDKACDRARGRGLLRDGDLLVGGDHEAGCEP